MIEHSKEEILIISPWLNEYVINTYKVYFEKALKRNVRIEIIYGIKGYDSKSNDGEKEVKGHQKLQIF
ncbi:hypothetical protein PL321_07820 [Caloramator sp. mosi_1]|uniref:hypothetical protein n=1 Tax=Caloramator sp. mosi_1 TaxID=3023090 RepID=UPI0023606794|nr:hypothetical protein [Caloramator sp. mosi_1]WDC85329.1 hypothetical protein PL321_07820 [Caloramator sp. mosi_1]